MNMSLEQNSWQPTASIETLKQRAELIKKIRAFFDARNVLEIDVPLMAKHTVTDPFINSIATQYADQTFYLQTSPEYFMKRLLAFGSGDIYSLSKSFRDDELGRLHNPEFTLLEWYRIGYDHQLLMNEVNEFIQAILSCEPAQKFSYQAIFLDHLQLDPLTASLDELKQAGHQLNYSHIDENNDSWLQVLFTEYIEPNLIAPTFIYDFPASQAALAQLNPDDNRVAERFELYIDGIEIANGFHELQDAKLQQQRFEDNNQKRRQHNLPEQTIDKKFISALEHGLPNCSGVALGIDRLIMLALKKQSLANVLSFTLD